MMKPKSIMIQGTASSVGKSIMTAGLCRVFRQDGYKVAPFKSQNMALNSFITREGKEMGRAQVVQAEAAGIEPSVEMNPILLKPTTDNKAQVIVKGEVYGNMSAAEYHAFKPELAQMIRDVYGGLAAKHDIVVIEGAGSPAEINLRDKDFVNMGMAEIADAPVILVGDIDKGGVFAALAGTMLLLKEDERRRIKGIIINKFRGDLEILKPGLQMLEDIIHVPVLGVLPYAKLNIEDEDSLAERFSQFNKGNDGKIDVAVVKLPHMSNFTDFSALENIDDAGVRYIEQAEEMQEPDLILLPGTKNTMDDLMYIRKNGIEAEIKRLNEKGVFVFGICGGFQMLGMELSDPYKTESELLEIEGMGLLNTRTVFQPKKITTQVEGTISGDEGILQGLKGMGIKGYEIHMGTTDFMEGCIPYLSIHKVLGKNQEMTGGVRNAAGNVFGTYIHGIFDNMSFASGLISNLRKIRGKEQVQRCGMGSGDYWEVGEVGEYGETVEAGEVREAGEVGEYIRCGELGEFKKSNKHKGFKEYKDHKDFKELQYDMLADMIRKNLDIDKIYKIIGI